LIAVGKGDRPPRTFARAMRRLSKKISRTCGKAFTALTFAFDKRALKHL
jgi:hypothetical protein